MGEITVKTYVGSLAVFAISSVASWIYWYGLPTDPAYPLATVVFGLLLCLIRMFPIRISERSEISALDVGMVAAVVVLGPVWATVAALPCAVLVGKRDWLRTAYVAAQNTVQMHLAGIVLSVVTGPLLLAESGDVAPAVYATLAAAATFVAVNCVVEAGLLKVKYDKAFGATWKELVEPYLVPDAVSVITAGFFVLALLVYGPAAAVVVVVGSVTSQVIVYRARDKVAENRELRGRISSLEKALTDSNQMFGTMIIEALGRRDGYTHRHAAATAVYAADIAGEMKLDDTRVELLRMAGLLHNIGMFGLPEELLVATGKINSIAKSAVFEHPVRGAEALSSIEEFREMAGWVRWHHERPDGRGYPDKLRGPWIPLEARILGVAQGYAAMVLDQPRRPGMSFEAARSELNAGIDTQFDGPVTRAFLRILDTESEGYRMADDYRFAFPANRDSFELAAPDGDGEDVGHLRG